MNLFCRCPAVGIPAPEIEFYKDDILLSPSPELKLDFFHGVLTIKRTTLAAKGNYKCVARNSAGVFNASSDVELLSKFFKTQSSNHSSIDEGKKRVRFSTVSL